MAKNKKRISVSYILYLLIILFSLSSSGCGIIKQIDEKLFATEISALNLSQDEKAADFEELYNDMIESVPSLEDHKALYSIDFKNKKDYYVELIKNTQNDFEFYCTMAAIHEDIPGMHTDICFPDYSDFSDMGCYNQEKILKRKNLKPLTEYWYKCIGEACEQFSEVQCVDFKYVDGGYLFNPAYSGENYQDLKTFELTSINNQQMSDYVVNHISYYNIKYDTKRKKPYRRYVTLNDRVGEKVNATLTDSKTGNTVNKELYIDIKIEVVNTVSDSYEEDEQSTDDYAEEEEEEEEEEEDNIYSYCDDENNIGYVKVDNFANSQGEELVTTLESMKAFGSIIIDLRDNYGGYTTYGEEYLYAPLYNDDVTTTHSWFIPASKANKSINNAILNRFFYRTGKDESGFNYTREYLYEGVSQPTKQAIYYLINESTGSAADEYIAMVSENNLGTIIGTNSDGEGLADSFICNSLENSGLVYIHFPSLCYNEDGTNNSLYGTSPDIYVEQTKESFYKKRDLIEKEVDVNLYTEKVKYDNVLIETIQIIQQLK